MSAEIINEQTALEDHEAMIERAIAAANSHRDTPLNGGFGFELETTTPTRRLMTQGESVTVTGFRLPADVVDLQDTERISSIEPVPYAGDEKPHIHIRQTVDEFMLNLPA